MVSNCCGATPVYEIPIDGWAMCNHCYEMSDFISVDEPEKKEKENKKTKQVEVKELLDMLLWESEFDNEGSPYKIAMRGLLKMNMWEISNLTILILMMSSAKKEEETSEQNNEKIN